MDGRKTNVVGQFFEGLGHHLLGGNLCRDEYGDILLQKQELSVEVKSSGIQSSYGFRLSTEQLDEYRRMKCFLLKDVLYMFFAYQNRSVKDKETGVRKTQLSIHNSEESIKKYLANSIQWCCLVDVSIVDSWEEHFPHSTTSILGHPGKETVNISPTYLSHFMNGSFKREMDSFKLDPAGFAKLSGKLKTVFRPDLYNTFHMIVPTTVILPREKIISVQRRLGRRGFRLYREAI